MPERYWGPGGKRGIVNAASPGDIAMPNPGDPHQCYPASMCGTQGGWAKGYKSVGLVPLLSTSGTPNYDLANNKIASLSAALAVRESPTATWRGKPMMTVFNRDSSQYAELRGDRDQPSGPYASTYAAWLAAKASLHDGWVDAAQLTFTHRLHVNVREMKPCCYGDDIVLTLSSGQIGKNGVATVALCVLNPEYGDFRPSEYIGQTFGPLDAKNPVYSTSPESYTTPCSFVHVGQVCNLVTNGPDAPQQRIARNVLACVLSEANANSKQCTDLMRNPCGQLNNVQCNQPTAAGLVDVRAAVYNFCNNDGQRQMKGAFCQVAANSYVDKRVYGKMNRSVQLYCQRSVAAAKGDASKVDRFCGCYWPYIKMTKAYQALQQGPLQKYLSVIDNQMPRCRWQSCNVGALWPDGTSVYEFVNQMTTGCQDLVMCVNEVDVDGASRQVIMKDLKFTNDCSGKTSQGGDKDHGSEGKDQKKDGHDKHPAGSKAHWWNNPYVIGIVVIVVLMAVVYGARRARSSV